jgi:hypothetical protein
MTSDECQRRADEAKALAVQTQDLWEREVLLRIATHWHLIASHRVAKESPLQPLDAVRSQAQLRQSLPGKAAIRQRNGPTVA